jgi:hypothetical protein
MTYLYRQITLYIEYVYTGLETSLTVHEEVPLRLLDGNGGRDGPRHERRVAAKTSTG